MLSIIYGKSKKNNFFVFQSFEAETVNSRNQLKLSPNRPQRPKSEVLDNGFSGRMEYFASSKGSRGEKGSPRVTRDPNQSVVSNIKDSTKCSDKSDDSDQSDDIKIVTDKNCNVKLTRGKGDALVDTRYIKNNESLFAVWLQCSKISKLILTERKIVQKNIL